MFSGLNRDNVVIFFLFFNYKPIGLVLSYLMMHCLAQVAEEEKNVSVTQLLHDFLWYFHAISCRNSLIVATFST